MRLARRSRIHPVALAALVAVVATASSTGAPAPHRLAAQQAGHATVPSTGANAPAGGSTTERDQDPVIAGVEELRRLLAATGKSYKKMNDGEKAGARHELLAALARARSELTAAHALVAAR